MQTTTLKNVEVARDDRVLRISRPPVEERRHRPSAAVYKPSSKWTVVIAFILAVALHAGAVVWVEMQQEKPPVEVGATIPTHSAQRWLSEQAPEAKRPSLP